jgi:PAS domain S-box-containing protein
MRLGLKVEAIDLSQRTQWYAFVRLIFLLAIAGPGILSVYLLQGWVREVQSDIVLATIALSSNLLFYGLTKIHKNPTYQKYLAAVWIMLDIVLITILIFTKGGIESRSPILYAIPILISAALFGRKAIYISAFSSAVLYVALLLADYFNIIHSVGAINPMLRSDLPYVINSICFFPAILLIIALAVDFITKMLMEKQHQAKENLEALIRAQEIAKLGSWEWDIKNDEIFWSQELFRIFELHDTPTHLRYKTYLTMLHPDDIKPHRKAITDAIKKKKDFKTTHRILTPDGGVKYVNSEGRPILDDRGKVIMIAGTVQDTTEMYHLDAAKREFVSLASHQLRTPASGVKAFLSLLRDGYAGKLNRKQKNFVQKAFESNNRQLEIIDNLLNLASIESGKLTIHKEVIDIHELIKRCVPDHLPSIKDNKQKLVFNEYKEPVFVNVDPGNLQMAIDNLLSNAIKYSPTKGKITVTVRGTRASAYIEVTDNGIGIARKDVAALFQKFSRLNNPASKTVSGSGLGLYLARYVVKLHGGTITVRSKPSTGTRFTIKLPLWTRKE